MRSVLFALQRNKQFLMIGRIEVEVSFFSINLAAKFFVGQNTKKSWLINLEFFRVLAFHTKKENDLGIPIFHNIRNIRVW